MKNCERMQIAFITAADSEDIKSISGSAFHISRLLQKYCGDVHNIDKLKPNKMTVSYLLKKPFDEFTRLFVCGKIIQLLLKITGGKYQWYRTIAISKYYSKEIKKRLKEGKYDLIFAEKASIEIAYLDTDIPIIYGSDAVFKLMEDYYPEFTNLAKIASVTGNTIERMALQKARYFICTSEWAANSAEKDYGISRDKIKVISYPAFFDNIPPGDIVLKEKNQEVCKLLFVGVDWERKGGDIVVEAVNTLNDQGVKTILNICGCVPPEKYFNNKNIFMHGFLNKNNTNDSAKFEKLFLESHFLILPTKAECVASVFIEAAAYGLPVITTDVGGNSSVVIDSQNGVLLSLDADGNDFALAIKKILKDSIKYDLMRHRSRQMFDEKLNCEAWGRSVQRIVQEICAGNSHY